MICEITFTYSFCSWRDTTIGDHSKIDNLVQIGHNVVIGKCCMLCGQVGIAGSVTYAILFSRDNYHT
ncbi:putative UDP-3-O-(3-hydroxymyristoyl)glucosamine N-acyltransferase [Helianthus annuus]|nr:putative UDP-3-O-(3-hydroxymyristoyl)glucosamine N-acyltransferase [Helianthus annuus]